MEQQTFIIKNFLRIMNAGTVPLFTLGFCRVKNNVYLCITY